MEWKNKVFTTMSSFLLNLYYAKNKKKLYFVLPMEYDSEKELLIANDFGFDYCRFRALELAAEEIYRNNIKGNVAEAGVAHGHFAKIINRVFPDRKLYLYDTFEGFSESDKRSELEKGYTSEEWFSSAKDYRLKGAEKNMKIVRSKMEHLDNCIFRKGYFPESAVNETAEKFAFVSIDMDLYEPVFAALNFFYPRLAEGGVIFLHDYNHAEFKGIKVAVENFEYNYGKINKFPLPDVGGTLVITKNN